MDYFGPENAVSWEPWICPYKSFARPYLDYDDVIFDKAYNNSFQRRLKSLQYKKPLAVTGAINPFAPNASFFYPLKTSENRQVFWCF